MRPEQRPIERGNAGPAQLCARGRGLPVAAPRVARRQHVLYSAAPRRCPEQALERALRAVVAFVYPCCIRHVKRDTLEAYQGAKLRGCSEIDEVTADATIPLRTRHVDDVEALSSTRLLKLQILHNFSKLPMAPGHAVQLVAARCQLHGAAGTGVHPSSLSPVNQQRLACKWPELAKWNGPLLARLDKFARREKCSTSGSTEQGPAHAGHATFSFHIMQRGGSQTSLPGSNKV